MAFNILTVAGTTVSVSASTPTTLDANGTTGYPSLAYSLIGEVSDVGSYGKEYTLVTFNSVNDRKTRKQRGSYNNGQLTLKLAKCTLAGTDAGQAVLNAAGDTNVTFKVTNQDGTDDYFMGKVMSFMTQVGSVNSILSGEIKVELDSDVFSTI